MRRLANGSFRVRTFSKVDIVGAAMTALERNPLSFSMVETRVWGFDWYKLKMKADVEVF